MSSRLPRFRAFRKFNDVAPPAVLASPSTLNRYIADKHFAGDTLHSLIVRAPCCYANGICQASLVLRRELGLKAAIDTHRTYRLNEHGYHVKWMHIPEHVTPMNRVIIATR